MLADRQNERQADARIDPGVEALVARMNGTGVIKTIASCQGHPVGGKDPYVYFFADVRLAAALERRLREAATRGDPALNFTWLLDGRFNENYELVFKLYSPRLLERAYSLLNLSPLWFLTRHRIDAP